LVTLCTTPEATLAGAPTADETGATTELTTLPAAVGTAVAPTADEAALTAAAVVEARGAATVEALAVATGRGAVEEEGRAVLVVFIASVVL
jgi:hypothetical protein